MNAESETRDESDSMGPIAVPAQRLWGAQTQRSLAHFNISGERMPSELIDALAWVKRACAVVNARLAADAVGVACHGGLLRRWVSAAAPVQYGRCRARGTVIRPG